MQRVRRESALKDIVPPVKGCAVVRAWHRPSRKWGVDMRDARFHGGKALGLYVDRERLTDENLVIEQRTEGFSPSGNGLRRSVLDDDDFARISP